MAYLLSFYAITNNVNGSLHISVESPADLKIRRIVAGHTREVSARYLFFVDTLLDMYITKLYKIYCKFPILILLECWKDKFLDKLLG